MVRCGVPLCLLAILLGGGMTRADEADPGRPGGRPTVAFTAEVAVRWARLLYDRIAYEHLSPPVAARLIGYAQVALYEAVVPGMPAHRSLGGQLNDLPPLPAIDPGTAYDWPTVASSALAMTLRSHLAPATSQTLVAIAGLEGHFAERARRSVPPDVVERSVSHGHAIASAVLRWADTDGYAQLKHCPYARPVGEGLWVPTPRGFFPALQACWGRLRPFALRAADACAPPPPPVYSTDRASTLYAEAKEVYDTVKALTAQQREIANYWADDPVRTGTPPGHVMLLAVRVIERDGLPLDDAVEALARAGMAVADGFIACWHTKFRYNLLRPITYVSTVFKDPGWRPLLSTPPFPEYPSGHSVQSAAAAQVLTDQLGRRAFVDDTHARLGLAPRGFRDFHAAAQEAAISRLYGGIHFRSAIERGIEQGVCVGQAITARVRFRAP
jgi:hypothetical protein